MVDTTLWESPIYQLLSLVARMVAGQQLEIKCIKDQRMACLLLEPIHDQDVDVVSGATLITFVRKLRKVCMVCASLKM